VIVGPIGVPLGPNDHGNALCNVERFIEDEQPALGFTRLHSLLGESGGQRDDIDRSKLSTSRGYRDVGWDEPRIGSETRERDVPDARFVHADVTSDADAKRVIHEATAAFGRIDGLVNAAGIPAAERVLGKEGVQPLAHFTRVVTVNLIGTFNMIRLAAAEIVRLDPLEDGERGVIVCTASVAAFDGQVGQEAYAASKGGLVSLTLPLARYWLKKWNATDAMRPLCCSCAP